MSTDTVIDSIAGQWEANWSAWSLDIRAPNSSQQWVKTNADAMGGRR